MVSVTPLSKIGLTRQPVGRVSPQGVTRQHHDDAGLLLQPIHRRAADGRIVGEEAVHPGLQEGLDFGDAVAAHGGVGGGRGLEAGGKEVINPAIK